MRMFFSKIFPNFRGWKIQPKKNAWKTTITQKTKVREVKDDSIFFVVKYLPVYPQ